MTSKRYAINPNKVVDILLFDEVKYEAPDPRDIPFISGSEYKKPRITFVLDVDIRYRRDKIDMFFDTYKEAEDMYHIVIKKYKWFEIENNTDK